MNRSSRGARFPDLWICRFADCCKSVSLQIYKSGNLAPRPLPFAPRAHSNTEIRFQNSKIHPQAIPIHPQSIQIRSQTDDVNPRPEHSPRSTSIHSQSPPFHPQSTRSSPGTLNERACSGIGSWCSRSGSQCSGSGSGTLGMKGKGLRVDAGSPWWMF